MDSLWICLSTTPADFQQHLILVDIRGIKQINKGPLSNVFVNELLALQNLISSPGKDQIIEVGEWFRSQKYPAAGHKYSLKLVWFLALKNLRPPIGNG